MQHAVCQVQRPHNDGVTATMINSMSWDTVVGPVVSVIIAADTTCSATAVNNLYT
jgi:hypothetical protein